MRRDEYNLKTHNGEITIRNTETGNHRTFKISMVNNSESNLHGKRIVSLLTGSDNQRDYTGFGFVNDGIIKVWGKKYAESKIWQQYANMLQFPQDYPKCEYMFAGTCRKCNRKLTTPESVKSGIGPICSAGGEDRD